MGKLLIGFTPVGLETCKAVISFIVKLGFPYISWIKKTGGLK